MKLRRRPAIFFAAYLIFPFSIFAQTAAISTPKLSEPKIAMVLNSGDASISLIDMQMRAVIKTVPIGKEPHHLMMAPDQQTLLVANAVGNDIAILNATTGDIRGRIPNIIDPYQIGYSPNNQWFVVNGNRFGLISMLRKALILLC